MGESTILSVTAEEQSVSNSDDYDENPLLSNLERVKVKTRKGPTPEVCPIQAIALKMLYQVYNDDPRYEVDEDQIIASNITCSGHGSPKQNRN